MKRFSSAFIALAILLLALFTGVSAAGEANDFAEDELALAAGLGLPTEALERETITAKELFSILDRLVSLDGDEAAARFADMYPAARLSDAKLTRYDGMLAIYKAAEAMGLDAQNNEEAMALHQTIGEKCWELMPWNAELFGSTELDETKNGQLFSAAYFYAFGRSSLYGGAYLFDYDKATNSMRTEYPLTYREALLAAVRLYYSSTAHYSALMAERYVVNDALLTADEAAANEALSVADELALAAGLGLPVENAELTTVTARELFDILDGVVSLAGEEAAARFADVYPAARASDITVNRYDGMVAVYKAAEAMGLNLPNDEGAMALHQTMGDGCWGAMPWNAALFGDTNTERARDSQLDAEAYFYSFSRVSYFNNKYLFDYDKATNSMLTDVALSYKDALLAATRLYYSQESKTASLSTERVIGAGDKALLAAAEERKNAILRCETRPEPAGEVYYLSNNGSDENDGLTPETAWATLGRINCGPQQFKPGTTVLFERGGVWRGRFNAWAGVTYSAYGQGDKPKIIGSPENGADTKNWALWHDENGVKIWKYHIKLNDPGSIVFNDGESYASRVYSWWNGKTAMVWNDQDRKFDIVSGLGYDLQFYSDYPEDVASREIPFGYDEGSDSAGDLYLRCDAGNPGAVYDSIEFQCAEQTPGYGAVVQCNDDVVIDNLCVMYNNTVGIGCGNNNIVQNCEVAFIGGCSLTIGCEGHVPVAGEGIQVCAFNCVARNNYVHDCFDGGIIFEPMYNANDPARRFGNNTIEGNVIERCMTGVLVGVHCEGVAIPDVSGYIAIQDNDILYSGYGWSGDEHYDFTWKSYVYNGNAVSFWDDDYAHGEYTVANNRFYVSRASLVHLGLHGDNMPTFAGNTYAQNNGGYVFYALWENYQARATTVERVKWLCEKLLRDPSAVVLPFYE